MRKLGLLVAFLTLAALSPAPIKLQPGADVKILPEQSQEQLEREQSSPTVHPEVGTVDRRKKEAVESQGASVGAAETLQAAGSVQAKETLRKASERLDSKSNPWATVLWGILIAVLGFASVYAFRYWMAKTVPLPGDSRSRRVSW
jgi:hypothetical protein